jgi:uncharacterized protein (TIGR01777 family)
MRIVVSGSTGLIGRHVVTALGEEGHSVVALTRGDRSVKGAEVVSWDPRDGVPPRALEGATAVINLAGANIGAHRWSARQREAFLSSRLDTTRACVQALGGPGPTILVNASAVGFYGTTTVPVDETAPAGTGFLATLCRQWEDAAARGAEGGSRVVRARFGVVLANDGGALPRIARLARFGANGPLGSGRQWVSWIHVEDAVAAIKHALFGELSGPVNVVAPEPVQQRDLAKALGAVLHRPSFLPVPGAGVAMVLGRGPASLVLQGQAVIPALLDRTGFRHAFPSLESALRDLLDRRTSTP